MGQTILAKCNHCNETFQADIGRGMAFNLLYCDTCGKSITISIEDPQDTNDQFKLDFPDFDYNEQKIEASLEKCTCGGSHTFKAKPRCPNCNSDNYEEVETLIMYD